MYVNRYTRERDHSCVLAWPSSKWSKVFKEKNVIQLPATSIGRIWAKNGESFSIFHLAERALFCSLDLSSVVLKENRQLRQKEYPFAASGRSCNLMGKWKEKFQAKLESDSHFKVLKNHSAHVWLRRTIDGRGTSLSLASLSRERITQPLEHSVLNATSSSCIGNVVSARMLSLIRAPNRRRI